MLYLKTVNHKEGVIAVTPIGESYTLHRPGSDYYEHLAGESEGSMSNLSHAGVLSYDDPAEDERRGSIALSRGSDHFIVHENGSTFQRL